MQQSGQISAHIIQPKQSDVLFPAFSRHCRDPAFAGGGIPPLVRFTWRENFTGFTPCLFKLLFWLIKPLGQKLMQSKQPLHLA
jgi:hypothetical protein